MKRIITPYRVGVSLVLALAVSMMYVAFVTSVDRTGEDSARDQRVVTVEPAADSAALRQSRIFVQLASDYTGVLIVDGAEIPEDQLDRSEGLNTASYMPGPGTETGELKPGQRCAQVVYWLATSSREAGPNEYKWCWQVH